MLAVRFPVQYDVLSLGKALHPTCLGGMFLYLLLVALDKSVCQLTKFKCKLKESEAMHCHQYIDGRVSQQY